MKKYILIAALLVAAAFGGAAVAQANADIPVKRAAWAEFINVPTADGKVKQFVMFQPKAAIPVTCVYYNGYPQNVTCSVAAR